MKRIQKIIAVLLCAVTAAVMLSAFSVCAADEFEQSLSAFPQSYRAALRELHKKHPSWTFTAFKTGLDWNTAVEKEQSGDRSLFPNAYANVFKSVEKGDYNYSTGAYIQKDAGFVTANKLAVAYYMDPRNFLNEYGIFQFEDLSYDESFDEAAVEFVLRGTFMYNTKISYYNTKGKLINTNDKYSTVICEAGRKANINPCYLASKIRGEIGNGTSATSGKNSTYPGIYNFYNIGATDGAGAIERGLLWAKSGTTYSRPWTSPQKSIIGGAEFVAESYIAKGQFTTYLQKFNVNPASSYGVYNHQYMTNVCAAAVQAYFSYDSYYSAKLFDNKFSFSIPVFNNMDDKNGTDGKVALSGANNLEGYVNVKGGINVRKGPSTNNAKVLTKYLPQNTRVTVLEAVETDSNYYANVLNYPFWYKIKFNFESKTYTGYVPKSFVTITSAVAVRPGAYKPEFTSNDGKKTLHLVSYDARVAQIDGDVINFLQPGTTEIGAYDSTGRFSVVRYTVFDDGAPATVVDLKQTETTSNSFTLTWRKAANATGYTVYKYNEQKKQYESIKTLTGTKLQIKNLAPGSVGTYAVRARKKVGDTVVLSDFSKSVTAATVPSAPVNLSQTATSSDRYTLTWNKVSGATGYTVYKYNTTDEKYVKFATVRENKLEILGLFAAQRDKYKVRATLSASTASLSSGYSAEFTAAAAPGKVGAVKVSNIKTTGYTLSWPKVKNASGYTVYRLDEASGKFKKLASTKATSYTVSSLASGTESVYTVKAYVAQGGKNFFGTASGRITAKTLPAQVKAVRQRKTSASGYTLTWESVRGADGYAVYKYDSAKKRYVRLSSTSANSMAITGLKAGRSEKYKVRAFMKLGNEIYYAAYSSAFEAVTYPGTVKNVKVKRTGSSSCTLTWSKVKNADGYRVYRLDPKTGEYVRLVTVKGTSAKFRAAKGETLVVRAYTKRANAYFGAPSSPVTVK